VESVTVRDRLTTVTIASIVGGLHINQVVQINRLIGLEDLVYNKSQRSAFIF